MDKDEFFLWEEKNNTEHYWDKDDELLLQRFIQDKEEALREACQFGPKSASCLKCGDRLRCLTDK